MSFTMLYVTCGDKSEADKISGALLDKKLIACANVFPMKSQFWWQGELSNDEEYIAIMKTRNALGDEVEKQILGMHSYDTPCVIRWQASANDAYEKWINSETS